MTANEAHVSVSYRFSGSLGTKIEVIILRNKLKASTAQYSDADHKNAKKSKIVFSKSLKFFSISCENKHVLDCLLSQPDTCYDTAI